MDSSTPVSTDGTPIDAANSASPQQHRFTQWILMAAAALSYALFFQVAELASIPAHRGYEGSLLRQPSTGGAILGILLAALLFIGVSAVATFLLRRHWVYAGVMAASAGLFAWSFRGGPMRYVLLAPDAANASNRVFYALAVELLLLGAIVAATWLIVLPRLIEKREPGAPLIEKPDSGILQAIGVQIVLIGILATLLIQSGEKKQALFGILFASFVATAICQHYFHDERLAKWYWAGPIVLGIVGYILNAFTGDPQIATETGRLSGTFAALARPLPLDYASAGVLGALMGYWIGSEHPGVLESALVGGYAGALIKIKHNKSKREAQEDSARP